MQQVIVHIRFSTGTLRVKPRILIDEKGWFLSVVGW